jgi:hypothetical protein
MKKDTSKMIRDYLAKIGRKGGKARAALHSKEDLSKWAKLGGRPKKAKGGKGNERLQAR